MRLGVTIIARSLPIAALITVGCGAQSANAAPRKRSASASSATSLVKVPEATRLRAATPIVVFSRRRGQQMVEHLSVSVGNVGLSVATQVDVVAEFPDSISYSLRGPRKLQPGQRALFSLSGKKLVLRTGVPKIRTSCGSCGR